LRNLQLETVISNRYDCLKTVSCLLQFHDSVLAVIPIAHASFANASNSNLCKTGYDAFQVTLVGW